MNDVLIVGGGSAGCVLAERLSRDRARRVTLLEAGRDYADFDTAPPPVRLADGGVGDAFEFGEIDWAYTATGSSGGGEIPVPRGRLLGGSGAINGCIWLRGLPEDFERWSDLADEAWSWDRLLPGYRAIETDPTGDREVHGSDGPFPIFRHPREAWTTTQAAFQAACLEAGYGATSDHNDPAAMGVGALPLNLEDGVRWGPQRALITDDVRARPNLTIRDRSRALRLRLDGRRATGVEVAGPGAAEVLTADEIVLAGGAVGSPHLLLLSGIGPADALRQLGIEPLVDVPGVGRGVRDHPKIWITWRLRPGVDAAIGDPMLQLSARYTATDSDLRGDMMLYPNSIVAGDDEGALDFRIEAVNNLQLSAGTLTLRSADPDVHPRIDLGLLREERDRSRLVDAIERSLELGRTGPLAELVDAIVLPDVADPSDRSALADYVERSVMTGQHISSSCAMGRDDAPFAVVDADCRVRGVDGLRVIDGSIMPDSIRANTHATILAVAAIMADRIAAGD